ncbi:MAG: type II toxin-antitoxin system HicB family antitoxin [Longimicrobiales bacterium]
MIEYKGYVGVFDYDAEIESFHGRVINTRDVITFYGDSVSELQRELAASVEEYLELCAQRGEEPEKPYSGSFLVRADPELHRSIATAAARERKSVNAWVIEKLRDATRSSGARRRRRARARGGTSSG